MITYSIPEHSVFQMCSTFQTNMSTSPSNKPVAAAKSVTVPSCSSANSSPVASSHPATTSAHINPTVHTAAISHATTQPTPQHTSATMYTTQTPPHTTATTYTTQPPQPQQTPFANHPSHQFPATTTSSSSPVFTPIINYTHTAMPTSSVPYVGSMGQPNMVHVHPFVKPEGGAPPLLPQHPVQHVYHASYQGFQPYPQQPTMVMMVPPGTPGQMPMSTFQVSTNVPGLVPTVRFDRGQVAHPVAVTPGQPSFTACEPNQPLAIPEAEARASATEPKESSEAKNNGRSSSKYRGVYWNKSSKAWRARIWINGKSEQIGNFDSEEEAALAFDKRALLLRGARAKLNLPHHVHQNIAITTQRRARQTDGRKRQASNLVADVVSFPPADATLKKTKIEQEEPEQQAGGQSSQD